MLSGVSFLQRGLAQGAKLIPEDGGGGQLVGAIRGDVAPWSGKSVRGLDGREAPPGWGGTASFLRGPVGGSQHLAGACKGRRVLLEDHTPLPWRQQQGCRGWASGVLQRDRQE